MLKKFFYMFALGSVGRGSSKAMVDKSRIIRRLSIDNTNNQMEIVCQNIEVNQEDVFFEDCKGLDLGSKNQESRTAIPSSIATFAAKQIKADINLWKNGYLAKRKRCLFKSVAHANRKRFFSTKRSAISGPSFKKHLKGIKDASFRRLVLEKSLLMDAFANRGCLGFKDYVIDAEPVSLSMRQRPGIETIRRKVEEGKGDSEKDFTNTESLVPDSNVVRSSNKVEDAESSNNCNNIPAVIANETRFQDITIWGGYAISEVNVFYELSQGIMGVTATAKVCRYCLTCLMPFSNKKFHNIDNSITLYLYTSPPSLKGDGTCQTLFLPPHGVIAPHGGTSSKMATFKLEHPYESITGMTLVIGVAIEAIKFYTSGPDGQSMRQSPLLGQPFSGDTKKVHLNARRRTDMMVGFVGRQNRHRLTALGLIMRNVMNRNIFSCAWTPMPAIANSILQEHSAILERAGSAKIALERTEQSKGNSEKNLERELFCEAIEQGRIAERNAENGNWIISLKKDPWKYDFDLLDVTARDTATPLIATPDGVYSNKQKNASIYDNIGSSGRGDEKSKTVKENKDVIEFMALLRMREIDVGSAVDRAELLARRLWTSRILSLDKSLAPLRKLKVIIGLSRWLFNALAYSLAPEPVDRTEPDRLIQKGQLLIKEARILRER